MVDVDDNFYVIIMLNSGEQIMAILENEDEGHVEIRNPISVRVNQTMVGDKVSETISARPLCQLSEDNEYFINVTNIMFVNNLSEQIIPYYLKLCDAYNFTVDAYKDEKDYVHVCTDEKKSTEEEYTDVELDMHVKIIEELLDNNQQVKTNIVDKNFRIEGNNTYH